MIAALHPCSFVDFPGRVAAVVFTQGCNLRCGYCHNPDLCRTSNGRDDDRQQRLLEFLGKRRGRLGGVVVTGGEPTLHQALAPLLRDIRELGFAVKLDTNGMSPAAIQALVAEGLLDFVAVDVKLAPGTSSLALCGADDQGRRAVETLCRLARCGVATEARTTVVQDFHDRFELQAIARAVAGTGAGAWRLQPVRSGRVLDPVASFLPPVGPVLRDAMAEAGALGLQVSTRPA